MPRCVVWWDVETRSFTVAFPVRESETVGVFFCFCFFLGGGIDGLDV